MRSLIFGTSLLALAACGSDFNQPIGAGLDDGTFGNSTMNNSLIQSGEITYRQALAERFNGEAPDTITFDFNSATLTPAAQNILMQQADWIRQFPEVRFRVYGHTDLVGSNAYNKALGLRRAQAAVAFLSAQGISTSRLEAVASYGETRPVIATENPEERNRRTVTEVMGFDESNPLILNGKYAEVVFREYVRSATRPHPINTEVIVQVNPAE
jgi:peptidoglycan-associated lipoprotein